MTPARFLELRRPAWDRLQALIDRTRRRGVSALTEQELHEVTRLYPAVAVDAARARLYGLDAALQQRINGLAFAAHGLLYRRRHARPARAVIRFLTTDYPRLFRRLWPYMALSSLLFVGVSLVTYAAVRARPVTAYLFVPRGLEVQDPGAVSAADISERYRRMPGSIMTSSITANNISVAFTAFGLGITAGIGTGYVLLMNGMMVGAFCGHFANYGLGYETASFLVPHGALELFAVMVAGAAGLRLGLSLALPGRLRRGDSLKAGAREAVLLLLGTIPMFMAAGVLESFLTPSYLPGAVKILVGLGVLGLTLAYLLLTARPRAARLATGAGRT